MSRIVHIQFDVTATVCQTIKLHDDSLSDEELISSLNGRSPKTITTSLSTKNMKLNNWDESGKVIGEILDTETDYASESEYSNFKIME